MGYNFEGLEMQHLEGIAHLLNQCTDSFVFIYDLKADTYFISSLARSIFDVPAEKFENASSVIMNIIYPDDRAMVRSDLDLLKSGRKNDHNIEYRWMNKNGKPVWISCRGKIIPHPNQEKRVLLGRISIVDESDRSDILTGLPTETQMRKDFGYIWSQRQAVSGFILKIDIDNLNSINEQYGINMGDMIISKVGSCCRKACSGTAKAYKLSSDEFVCMNLSGKSAPMAQKLFQDIKREIAEAERGLGADVIFTISGGAVAFLNDVSQFDDFLKKVNYTIQKAKLNGRNNLVSFNAVDYSSHLRTLELQERLRDSMRNGFAGFELFYQPVVDAKKIYIDPDCTILNVIGCEALIRWNCPGYGMLSPDEFIPILEKTGMIVSVGRWILKTAFNQCREWNRVQKDFRMSVNLSYVQVKKSDIIRDIETALLTTEVNPSNITLELTESGYMDSGSELQKLTETFSNMGMNVDIDDFGTGYSNLRYLQYLHASTLKLDYSFVHKATSGNKGDGKVISHITQMAHELGMKVCMEGVETESDIEKLMIYTPDKFQGFFFGRPCNSDTFREIHLCPDLKREVYNSKEKR